MIANAHKRIDYSPLRPARRRPSAGGGAAAVWMPQAGPQTDAYHSVADVLGYGGEAGGGKTDLLIGLPGMQHWRGIIFRREFPRVRAIIERSREIFNARGDVAGKDSYNEGTHLWRLTDGRQLEFAAMEQEKDKLNYQGRPHDFYGFDEAPEFSEGQIRFVIGWNRSTHIDPATHKPQRCRVVLCFNPPMNDAGEWIVKFFLPWLAFLHPETYQHPNPARPGELRWYAQADDEDEEHEVNPHDLAWYVAFGGRHWRVESDDLVHDAGHRLVPQRGYEKDGKLVTAKSRTFIPASLKDNPILEATGYAATVNAMPEPYRSLLKGKWNAGKVADPWQLIPTAWVRAAEARHKARSRPTTALQSVGADIARGGKDRMAIAKLYGNWLAPLETHPGKDIADGPKGAALLLPYIVQGIPVGLDIISIGSSVYDSLTASTNDEQLELICGINFGAGAGGRTDRNGKLGFKNIRAAAYWKVRELLDPDNGDDFALPDDPELREELCAAHFEPTASGVQIEDKKKIIARIGRSPDKADAFALAVYNLTVKRPLSGADMVSF